jgi:polyphosphate kinase
MPRNIDHRVEVLFPIESPDLIRHVHDDILEVYLADTMKARRLMPDGSYERVKPKGEQLPFNSQAWLISHRAAQPSAVEL